ncbi:MAG: glycosyltransferase family 1 protein [Gemmataceae bacterium]|nr:glycosyltransferase family 1 protein [Gemmataceae bacterium]
MLTEGLDPDDPLLDGEHLVVFNEENVQDLLGRYLNDPRERERIARAGHEAVGKYDVANQAERILDVPRRSSRPTPPTGWWPASGRRWGRPSSTTRRSSAGTAGLPRDVARPVDGQRLAQPRGTPPGPAVLRRPYPGQSGTVAVTQPAYQNYWHVVALDCDEGLLQVAVAGGDGTASEIVRWSAPHGERVVQWSVESRGGPPVAPGPDRYADGHVFLRGRIGAVVPIPLPARGHYWVLTGTYWYAERKARAVDADVNVGAMPYEIAGSKGGDGRFPGGNFRR